MDNLQQTIDLIKQSYADTSKSALSPDVAKDFNLALNLVPFNLEGGARLLFPVLSPIRNQIPRIKGRGTAKRFKAVTGINTANVSLFASEGTIGNQVTTQEVDVTIPYVSMGLYDAVTLEAQIQGEGQVDARALAAANLLRAFMIQEESAILFGQGSAVTGASAGGSGVSIGGAVGNSPACATATATTGGTVGAGTYNVFQTVVTGMGESLAQSSSTNQVTTGATSTITVTPAVKAGMPNLSYNIYYKLSTDTNYNKVSTNGAPVTITSYTAGAVTLPGTDKSFSSLAFNGLLPQIAATGSGAYTTTVNGALASMATIDNAFKSMWDNGRADPDQVWANSKEVITVTGLTLGAGTPYYLVVKDKDSASAGYRVSRLVNKVTGTEVKFDVHPFMPQGNMLILSSKMPAWYPGSDIPAVMHMDMPLDYTQLDYFPTGPKWPFEIRTIGSLALYLPALQGLITGIS